MAEQRFDEGEWELLFAPLAVMTSAELLADVEAMPVGREMCGLLHEIDPADLDEAGLVRLARQWQRVEDSAAGQKLTAIASYAGPAADPDCPPGEPDFTDCEIAAALNLSTPAAQRTVATARSLTSRLRATLGSLTAGAIGMAHVRHLVELTDPLTPDRCALVESRVLEKAPRQAPGQFRTTVRKVIDRVDAAALQAREQAARACTDVQIVHDGDGTATLYGTSIPSVDAALINSGMDAWARGAKAAGDPRSLAKLRAAALADWAERYLTGATGGSAPRQHSRPITVLIAVDLPTYLGLTDHPAELLGTGALIPAQALRDLLPDAQLRRIITDPMTGELLDYGRTTYRVPADLAGYTAARWVTSSGPGSQVPAGPGDMDHAEPWDDGGETNRDNIHPPNRRWHRAKTIGGWTVTPSKASGWTWTSPLGLSYDTDPHDYRLGP